MKSGTDLVDIFSFHDYRLFLKAAIDEGIRERGLSYRYFARKAGLSSPNYLQRVVKGERSLTTKTAGAVGEALALGERELEYFLRLVALDQAPTEERAGIEQELRRIIGHAHSEARNDESIHSSWLHGVLWCLAGCAGFVPDPAIIQRRLRTVVPLDEIQRSLDFLLGKGYIASVADSEPPVFEQKNIRFKVHNDERRRLDLQRNHIRYLDMAKQRVVDDLAEREYQGLTIAIPEERFAEVKTKLREFVQNLSESLAYSSKSDTIIRIQCAAYKLSSKKD